LRRLARGHDQGDGHRDGNRDRDGRHRDPRAARPGDDAAARRLELVGARPAQAAVGAPAAARPRAVARVAPGYFSRKRFTMGSRQSRPNARGVILTPMGPWRRLYSAVSIMRTTLRTVAGSKPCAIRSATPRLSST